MKNKQIIQILVLLGIALSAILFIPFKIPYKINSVAKLMPAQQWILSRGADGEIQTSTLNHLKGINSLYKLTSFERGESMVLELDPNLTIGQIVEEGDTVGIIYSSSQHENLLELNGELSVLTATLKASTSGEKKTEIKEAQQRLEMAKSEYDKQIKIVERLKKQFLKEIIAEEVYQTASDELKVLEKAINVSQAELESSLSGEKIETINMLKEQIIATENRISFLQNEIDTKNSIIIPFMGRIESSLSEDTLLVISNIDLGIAYIPVALDEAKHIGLGAKVSFISPITSELLIGEVLNKQPVMQIIGGQQCLIVLANVSNFSSDFITGMITQAEINCSDVTIQTYLKRNIKI